MLGSGANLFDLRIEKEGREYTYKTYRKPLNSYAYVPDNSFHAKCVKKAIVAGETVRMLRTNKFEADFDGECTFFLVRLKSRGYDVAEARQVMGRYDWCDKKKILVRNR